VRWKAEEWDVKDVGRIVQLDASACRAGGREKDASIDENWASVRAKFELANWR